MDESNVSDGHNGNDYRQYTPHWQQQNFQYLCLLKNEKLCMLDVRTCAHTHTHIYMHAHLCSFANYLQFIYSPLHCQSLSILNLFVVLTLNFIRVYYVQIKVQFRYSFETLIDVTPAIMSCKYCSVHNCAKVVYCDVLLSLL